MSSSAMRSSRAFLVALLVLVAVAALVVTVNGAIVVKGGSGGDANAGSITREGCESQDCMKLCFNQTFASTDCGESLSFYGTYERYEPLTIPQQAGATITEFGKDSTCGAGNVESYTTLLCPPTAASNASAAPCPVGVQFAKCTPQSVVVESGCETTSPACGACASVAHTLTVDGKCSIVRTDYRGNSIYGKLSNMFSVTLVVRQTFYASKAECEAQSAPQFHIDHVTETCNRGVEFFIN